MSSPSDEGGGPRRPRRRGLPDAVRTAEAEGIGRILDRLLDERPWRAGMAVGDLARRWEDVVGTRLAAECRPAGLDGGALLVVASSAAWAAQIGFLAEEVRRRANEVAGEERVSSVRVIVGQDGGFGARPRRA